MQHMKNALHSGSRASTEDGEESKESDFDDPSSQSSLERSGDEADGDGRHSSSPRSDDKHDDGGTPSSAERRREPATDGGNAVVDPLLGPADPTGSAIPAETESATEASGANHIADHSRE